MCSQNYTVAQIYHISVHRAYICALVKTFTCVVMPHADFGEFSKTEYVRKVKRVSQALLKLVGILTFFQSKSSRVSIFTKNNHPYIGICPRT